MKGKWILIKNNQKLKTGSRARRTNEGYEVRSLFSWWYERAGDSKSRRQYDRGLPDGILVTFIRTKSIVRTAGRRVKPSSHIQYNDSVYCTYMYVVHAECLVIDSESTTGSMSRRKIISHGGVHQFLLVAATSICVDI